MRSPDPGSGNHPLLHLGGRQPHRKDTAYPDFTFYRDLSAMSGDQASADGQPEPSTIRCRLSRNKRLEDVLDLVCWDSTPGVFESNVHHLVVHPGTDGELTISLYGLNGV